MGAVDEAITRFASKGVGTLIIVGQAACVLDSRATEMWSSRRARRSFLWRMIVTRRPRPRLRRRSWTSIGSSADEGALPKEAGWRRQGDPMMIGAGYTTRDFCPRVSWTMGERQIGGCSSNDVWVAVLKLIVDLSSEVASPDLLMRIALGRVSSCPLCSDIRGILLNRELVDRKDTFVDHRSIDVLSHIGAFLGSFAKGVLVKGMCLTIALGRLTERKQAVRDAGSGRSVWVGSLLSNSGSATFCWELPALGRPLWAGSAKPPVDEAKQRDGSTKLNLVGPTGLGPRTLWAIQRGLELKTATHRSRTRRRVGPFLVCLTPHAEQGLFFLFSRCTDW